MIIILAKKKIFAIVPYNFMLTHIRFAGKVWLLGSFENWRLNYFIEK